MRKIRVGWCGFLLRGRILTPMDSRAVARVGSNWPVAEGRRVAEPSGATDPLTPTAIERKSLPVSLGRVAEYESWRKERHRPATYVHKWWARRLGSVFREVLVKSANGPVRGRAPQDRLRGVVVYDPFAGSGTTLVEAVKLGARVVGRDINPIATLTQRQALQSWDVDRLKVHFGEIELKCRDQIESLHVAEDGLPVLHYFWVAVAKCVTCAGEVELFSSYIFAKHAYPGRHPQAQATCPRCHGVCATTLGEDTEGFCPSCQEAFSFDGPVLTRGNAGRYFVCSDGHRSSVLEALAGTPPRRRMYAKVVRTADGGREYRGIDDFDRALYERASSLLAGADPNQLVLPAGVLEHGANTAQALRWGFRTWAAFFNDRQLYSLGLIGAAIRDLPRHSAEREALAAAFGKTLEHHNLFCSFKGEGTGPVRSIFHNHVLRPERCSVEGNPWGAEGGSGGFAEALNRLQAAQGYKDAPSDLVLRGNKVETVRGRSAPIDTVIASSWKAFESTPDSAYVATGNGGATDMPDRSVGLVITDPPYVDNVHYSELADFFHSWMSGIQPHAGYPTTESTRDKSEVQNASPTEFRRMAAGVWRECTRVLADDGLLVFSFHQARSAGWRALMASLHDAGLVVTATRPVIAEVTTSLTKVAALAPNRIDVIVVCRKKQLVHAAVQTPRQARTRAIRALRMMEGSGLSLGPGDVLSAVRAAVLAQGTRQAAPQWGALELEADNVARLAVEAFFRRSEHSEA